MIRPNVVMIVADESRSRGAGRLWGAGITRRPTWIRWLPTACAWTTVSAPMPSARRPGASILTGKYSHSTGIKTLSDVIDHDQESTLGHVDCSRPGTRLP